MYLYKNIKAIRNRLGMNLVQFGKLFGVSSNTISYYENGKRQPPWQFLAKLENMTGITFREMYSHLINIVDIPEISRAEIKERITSPIFTGIEMAIVEEPGSELSLLKEGDPPRYEMDNMHRLLAEQARHIAEIEARVAALEKKAGTK